MAIRIQLRRDTAANWVSANPTLRAGEIGIETDTLKFKIGNGSSTWNSITSYANVTPSGLSNSLGDYILAANQGTPGGPAELDSNGDLIIPENSIILWNDADYTYTTTVTATEPTADRTITLPNNTGTVALTSDLVTTNVSEGTNLYFTDERAQDAVAAALAAGTHTNITVSYNDNANSISLTGATTYSNEDAVDAVAAALAAGTHTNISVTYDDNGNAISLTGAVTYTDENAQDAVGNAVGNGLDYDDNTGAISVDPSEFALSAVGAPTADVTMASYKITNLATPTASGDAATKAYVDNTTAGLNFHAAVHAATTANLQAAYSNGTSGVGATLTANSNEALVVDGHTLNLGERVLVKNQTTGFQNGIYDVTATGDVSNPWVLTRSTDSDNSPAGEMAYGDFTFVQNGSTNAGFGFIVNTTGTITIGTTAISYTQFNAGQVVVAGNGLTEPTAGTLAIDTGVTVDLSTAQTLTNKTLNSPNINEAVALTASSTELNILDGVTASTAEINVLDGITSSTSELNILDGVTASASEINILDGATLSTTELNYVDGVTSSIQTQINSKAPLNSPVLVTPDLKGRVEILEDDSNGLPYDPPILDIGGRVVISTSGITFEGNTADNYETTISVVDPTDDRSISFPNVSGTVITTGNLSSAYPSQSGNNGKYLTTDGSSVSWATLVVPITTGTETINQNTAYNIDSFNIFNSTSVEYTISLKQGSKVRTSKVIVQTDGTSVDMTEFAITETGGQMSGVLVSAESDFLAGGILKVTVTDAATTNVTVKFSKITL